MAIKIEDTLLSAYIFLVLLLCMSTSLHFSSATEKKMEAQQLWLESFYSP